MSLSKIKTTVNLRRPNWITSVSKQLVVMVGDRSPSMFFGTMAKDAAQAEFDLLKSMADPINKDGFNYGLVHFSGKCKITCPTMPATRAVRKIKKPIIKVTGIADGTNIHLAFGYALKLVLDYNKEHCNDKITHLRPVVCLFSDGEHNYPNDPSIVTDRLKKIADIVTIAFAGCAGSEQLKSWATSEQHFTKCTTGSDLRMFLSGVGDTICQTRAAGINATQALTQITQR